MPLLAFSDKELDWLNPLASALPPSARGAFLQVVGNALAAYPIEARGPGLTLRIAAVAQLEFVRSPVAVGVSTRKYGRSTTLDRPR